MKVTINISLKEGVLDPQGRAVERSLSAIGFTDATNVRIGKQITLDVDAEDGARAHQRVARMCEQILANTVIEDYEITIEEDQ
ncbi:MAG: phosphoribosylformylglycinamidine synthase subunit PurS [Candidatus Puniceispirillaceae bacterium]